MAVWIVVLSIVVKVSSLPSALRLLSTRVRPKKHSSGADLATAIDAVLGVNFLIFRPSCWKRAAVLHRYLSLSGVPTTIVFGLRKERSGELIGHAWLQSAGEPLLEKELPAYTVTYSFPSKESFRDDLAIMATSQSPHATYRSDARTN